MLADDFFLIAHDDDSGRARLHPAAVRLGLAAALLAELLLEKPPRIQLYAGRVAVVDRTPPSDALAHATLDQLLAEPNVRDVRSWLAFLSYEATTAVGGRLVRTGSAQPVRVGRWRGGRTRIVPVNPIIATQAQLRLRYLLDRGYRMSVTDVTLAGLCQATGLLGEVLWDSPDTAHEYLDRLLEHLDRYAPGVPELFAHTEAAIGDAVLSHHKNPWGVLRNDCL